jgi:purine-binding chemotaxis protein CheW
VKQLLAFEIDGYKFGLHLGTVQKVVQAVEIQPVPNLPEPVCGLINVHGTVMPVLNTRKRLGLTERQLELSDFFIIASGGPQPIALIVDSIQGVINYSDSQLMTHDAVLTENTPVNVLRIVDGMLLIYDPDKSLDASQWSTLAIALQQPGVSDDLGN